MCYSDKYSLDLNGPWNIKNLPNHIGRHTDKHHEYMLTQIRSFDQIANGNQKEFLKLFEGLKGVIEANTSMMYMK